LSVKPAYKLRTVPLL